MTYTQELEKALEWCDSQVGLCGNPDIPAVDRKAAAQSLANSQDVEIVLYAARLYLEQLR